MRCMVPTGMNCFPLSDLVDLLADRPADRLADARPLAGAFLRAALVANILNPKGELKDKVNQRMAYGSKVRAPSWVNFKLNV